LNSVEKFLTNQVRESWCTGVVAEVVGWIWIVGGMLKDLVAAKYLIINDMRLKYRWFWYGLICF